jgi:glucose-1-phosphate thymidylyltransferase
MTFSFLDGWWTDAGTFESLLRAANLVAHIAAKKQVSAELAAAVEGSGRS